MSSPGDQDDLKVFYVSLQRSGTKSFGEFFRQNGYKVASWAETHKNGWMELGLAQGQIEALVRSEEFKSYTIFEDGPWFDISTIRFLYWHFPNSRFIYFHRPVEDWFKSMLVHSRGYVLGNAKRHCQIYNRLAEYYAALEFGNPKNKLRMAGKFQHYKLQFENHAFQVRAFFEDKPKHRFFHGELYDKDKWLKVNAQMNLALSKLADIHVHKSQRKFDEFTLNPLEDL